MGFWQNKYSNEFIPFDGKIYNALPSTIGWTSTGANQVVRVTFNKIVAITFIYVRVVPANSIVDVFGDQFGPRQIANEINAINLESVGSISGAPTITRVSNSITLDASNNIVIFTLAPWRTRNIYLQGSLTGTYNISVTYI